DAAGVRIVWIAGGGPGVVRRSKEMAERNVKASHRLGPILVTVAGDRAIAQVRAMIDIPFTLKATEVMMSSHAHLLFRAERREGVWRSFWFRRRLSARRDRAGHAGPDHRGRSRGSESFSPHLSS